ncbi:nuclease-related domain-containing protein [Aeromicrobium ponti]|uniref:Nuclease-like protein n=1 Tax=Cytobacillus oceanisediminis TaxID=665099 RepID=A0A562K2X0_9BACI|nr:NERD domain-containing protein [Cytobacillus oceanisediminis]TWH89768.1 nuclease-like protein [Cytobacillus oceanisediminis]
MIEKERFVPIRIQKNHALLKRIPKNHPKRPDIESDQTRRLAGYKGEQAIDFYLSKLPEKEFLIFHDLRLSNGRYFFQIDTLLISASFALVLEVKNYGGTLFFDPDFNQLIQTNNKGETKGYPNPIEQASQQSAELKKWFQKPNFAIPVEFLIIISKPSTILKTAPGYSKMLQKVQHAQFLLRSIEKIKVSYKNEAMTPKDLKKITRMIIKEHIPETVDILKYYGIPPDDIQTGVICKVCSSYPMKRHFGIWYCTKCQSKDKDAHVHALKDLFLLNKNSPLTNQEICRFLHLPSGDIAKKLLTSMQLPYSGSKKGRVYFPPPGYQQIKELE